MLLDVSLLFPKDFQLMHTILKSREDGEGNPVIHWGGHPNRELANAGQHIDPLRRRAPRGPQHAAKGRALIGIIIMLFVTANDSARVENKRGASGLVPNGAEE